MERLFFALPSKELTAVKFFPGETLKNIKEIFPLGAGHKQLLDLPECGILCFEERKVFIQKGLKSRLFTDRGGTCVEMG